jgi:hypothetical protein
MVALLLSASVALAGTTCRADDTSPAPVAPAPATGVVVLEETAPQGCGAAPAIACEAHEGGNHGLIGRLRPSGNCARKLVDWLTYCPGSCGHCGRTCAPTCVPPLYTYFLWHCGAGCGGAGCGGPGCGAPAAVVASQQPAAQPAVVVAEQPAAAQPAATVSNAYQPETVPVAATAVPTP